MQATPASSKAAPPTPRYFYFGEGVAHRRTVIALSRGEAERAYAAVTGKGPHGYLEQGTPISLMELYRAVTERADCIIAGDIADALNQTRD